MRRVFVASLTVTTSFATPAFSQNASSVRTLLSTDSMNVAMPTVSPDGRWLVFVRVISNQESQILIRPYAGGPVRTLLADKGSHSSPRFTPKGDRLVFVSTLPRRTATDIHQYLVSASFDASSGTLTSAPRQLSLDGLQSNPRSQYAISPDGSAIAYIDCCTSAALKVLPVNGGNARTLVTSEFSPTAAPGWLSWTPDSRFVTYHIRIGEFSERKRISVEGGTPTVVARIEGGMGPVTPDQRYYFTAERQPRPVMHLFDMQGRKVASVGARMRWLTFSSDGRTLLGADDNATAAVRVVPIAGGPSRLLGRGVSYEWTAGWSPDGRELHISEVENDATFIRIVGLDGTTKSNVRIPDGALFTGFLNGQLIVREGPAGITNGWKIFAQSLNGGSRKLLADSVVGMYGDPVGAGGMYYGVTGNEFYYRKLRGDELQIRAMRADGNSRLLGTFSAKLTGLTFFMIAGNRVAYTETSGDSVRLRVVPGPDRRPITLLSVPRPRSMGEYAWSHDGRMLSLLTGAQPQRLTIFRFDDAGNPSGTPQSVTLPFEYAYETFWLPDGSGLTMIAQPRDTPTAEVALVRLSDPERPVLLSRNDPGNKWGHALSPDGRYVAYMPEVLRGSTIQLIDVASLLKNVPAPPR